MTESGTENTESTEHVDDGIPLWKKNRPIPSPSPEGGRRLLMKLGKRSTKAQEAADEAPVAQPVGEAQPEPSPQSLKEPPPQTQAQANAPTDGGGAATT